MSKKLKRPLALIFSAVVFLALLMFAPSEITRSTGFEVIAGAEEYKCPQHSDSYLSYSQNGNGTHYAICYGTFDESECGFQLPNQPCTFNDYGQCVHCGWDCNHPSKEADGKCSLCGCYEVSERETAVSLIKKALLNRDAKVRMILTGEIVENQQVSEIENIIDGLYSEAITHTYGGNSALGDYIAKTIETYGYGRTYGSGSSGLTVLKPCYSFTYYTTSAQEQAVTTALSGIYTELKLSECSTDLEKVYKIYNWIVNNVSYDNENLNNESNKTKYTAYGALIDQKAVCQGFAALFYRMCLDNGIDCRIITGLGNGGAHAWNMVKVGGKYYYADATWDCKDASNEKPGTFFYFLRSSLIKHEESTETGENVSNGYTGSIATENLSAFKAAIVNGAATAVHLDGTALTEAEKVWYKITTSGEGCTATVTVKPNVTDNELAAQVLLSETIENHSFDEKGFCTVCKSVYQPAVLNGTTYEISNAGQLYWFAEQVNGENNGINAILTDNITVNTGVLRYDGALNSGSFKEWTPIYNYTGTFDGAGHTISGLYFNVIDGFGVGLFGSISTGGTVKNVGVVDSYFSGLEFVGGVCGSNNGGKIENCYNTGAIIGTYDTENGLYAQNVGGVCGENSGTIKDCYNEGSVSGCNITGGVCGYNNEYGTIENCYNKGTVTSSGENANSAGGVCGGNSGTITDCYNKGSVSGQSYVGGVCGINSGTIKNSYNTGSVSGRISVGGVCGENSGTIANCHNTEEVSGNDYRVGGVCGMNKNDGTIKNSYNTGSVSNANGVVGGVCGMNDGIIQNSYNTGSLSKNGDVGGVCGQNINGTIENCYCLVGTATNAIGVNVGTSDKVESKTLTQFNGGEVAYLLQSGQTEDENGIIPEVWGQDLSTTTNYPVLGGAKVYQTLGCVGYSNDPTKKHKDENGDEICDVCKEYVDGIGAVAGHSLSLSGNIGVKFFMLLSKDIEYSETAYMQFTLPNGTTEKVLVRNAERDTTKVPDRTCYVFTCEVAAKEMTDTITAQMFDGNGNGGKQHTYTVKDYADYILSHTDSYSTEAVALVKAMMNYGAYSQTYFGYKTENLANADIELALSDIKADTLREYAASFEIDSNYKGSTAYYGSSLVLKSGTDIKHYFTPAADIGSYTCSDGTNSYEVVASGSYIYVRVPNILAHNLGNNVALTLYENETAVGTISYSPMSYAYAVLSKYEAGEKDTLRNVVIALYDYYTKAKAYRAA